MALHRIAHNESQDRLPRTMKIVPIERCPTSHASLEGADSAVGDPKTPVDVDAEISRESLRVRCNQALRIFPYLTGVLIIVGILLWREVEHGRLAAWLFLTFVALCGRVLQSHVVTRKLHTATHEALDRFE